MTPPRLFWLGVVSALALAVMSVGCADSEPRGGVAGDTLASARGGVEKPVFNIRSVTLDARRRPDSTVLVHLRNLGVTHLTLVSFGWQHAADEPRIRADTSDGWYTESHRGIRALARRADALGMEVILKPHIWTGGYDGEMSRSDIGFATEEGWKRWEASYRRFLMTYARLAQQVDADVLVLGTELTRAATERPRFWRDLARQVRTVYDGDLTYAANWHEEYRTIEFWDTLDYVGVQAYFPLADGPDPRLEALRARWQSHRRALAQVHRRTDTPVLFTEIGYRSAASTAEAPWRWPERDAENVPADSILQARCYRAFLSVMHRTPWFAGGIIWKWHPDGGDRRPTAFTPQGKPAERVLRRWFTEIPTDSGRSVTSRAASGGIPRSTDSAQKGSAVE